MPAPDQGPLAGKVLALVRDVLTPKNLALVFGLVVVGATAAFGGMEAQPPAPLETVSTGAPVAADPFAVTITGGYTTHRAPGTAKDSATSRFIVLTGRLTNTADRYVGAGVVDGVVRLSGVRLTDNGRPAEDAARVTPRTERAGEPVRLAQPGVAVDVTWTFEQPASEPEPGSVAVSVRGRTLREDTLSGGLAWLDPADAARVDVRLERR